MKNIIKSGVVLVSSSLISFAAVAGELTVTGSANASYLINGGQNSNGKGIGISKEHQYHIFDKLYRVPEGNTHNVKGFGLGLSYAKSIIELHGGSVSLSSQFNQGSTFKIILPKKSKLNYGKEN